MGNPIPPLDETAAYDRAVRYLTALAAAASQRADDDPRWGEARDNLVRRRAALRPQHHDHIRAVLDIDAADLAAQLASPQ
ncbi:hypothetical protein IU450_38020 [Nocardia abscessus]|uniref:hypothetical protein n=1 Tax=Nocardia abscessus TaxID=120957 RepID=UPI0018936021|nr:hypothetical protein [Nocardia abscessus]MBF6341634.1 hypothetical protein [Nocardia abscessus]